MLNRRGMKKEVAVGTVIQDRPQINHRSQPRWDRFERADLFAQYRALRTQGISERQAAKELKVPRTTLQAWHRWHDTLDTSHIPHPSDGDPRYFLAAFFARTTNPPSGMVSSHERRYTKHLRPWRVVWVSCSRLSKRTKSNICPL